ncbi:HNH endonuclease family protein [Mobiluncus curtisii]|uniref:HNH endonuclease family protein n=1 Tax=Mobiluncus curtisii TaxID=2051 RepID=UPI003D2DC064
MKENQIPASKPGKTPTKRISSTKKLLVGVGVLLILVVLGSGMGYKPNDLAPDPATSTSPATSPKVPRVTGAPTPTSSDSSPTPTPEITVEPSPTTPTPETSGDAAAALASLPVKGRAPKTGYRRAEFGRRWRDIDHNGCDTRNDILNRDLTNKTWKANTHGCVVLSGTLTEPYSGETKYFHKSQAAAIQIDHVVALSDAWQKGAQALSAAQRETLANDPLNLLAVDGRLNQQKSDSDAATWLPPRQGFRCAYVSRQIAVKAKYRLWVTPSERDAMVRILSNCPGQPLPASSE